MRKPGNIKLIILLVYIFVLIGVLVWLFYPLLLKPRVLSQSKIPSLSVSGLNEINSVFSKQARLWVGQALEPDLNNYTFGQSDPI